MKTKERNRRIKALEGSVAKWWGIAFKGKKDHGGGDCPLCEQYWGPLTDAETRRLIFCEGCPIKEETEFHMCNETPYTDYKRKETPKNAYKFFEWLEDLLVKEIGK